MTIKTSPRRYGYGRFRKVPMEPMPPASRRGNFALAWRRYCEAHNRLVPTIAPGDVLREGVWAGTTAREALKDGEFADWLLNYPHAMYGEPSGLLHLLLRMRVRQFEAQRAARRRWKLVLWSIRLRNAIWNAYEKRAVRCGTYADPPIASFAATCFEITGCHLGVAAK